MATLRARIRGIGQRKVKFDGRRRPILIPETTSYFVSSRAYESRSSANFKNITDALAELARAEAIEKAPKLVDDFRKNASEPPVVLPIQSAPAASGSWQELKNAYLDSLRLKIKKDELSPKSEKRYLRSIREFDTFLTANQITKLSQITMKVFDQFVEHRIDSGAKHGYVADVKNLNPMFEFAVKRDMIVKNPVTYASPKGDAERGAEPFSPADLKKMDSFTQTADGKDYRLMYLVMLTTGLRKSDLIDLRWSQVNGTHIQRIAIKNHTEVRLPLVPELKELLDKARKDRNPQPQDFVLLNPKTDAPFTESRFYEHSIKLGKEAGTKRRTNCHCFRDSFAEQCRLRGCSIEQVALYLGDDIDTTKDHYFKNTDPIRDQADEKLLGKAVA